MRKKIMENEHREAGIEVAIEQIRQLRVDVTRIETKIDANYVTKEEQKAVVKRVDDLEDNNKWIVRLVISLIVTAMIGLVIVVKQ